MDSQIEELLRQQAQAFARIKELISGINSLVALLSLAVDASEEDSKN